MNSAEILSASSNVIGQIQLLTPGAGGPDHPWLPPFDKPLFYHEDESWTSKVVLEACGPDDPGDTVVAPILIALWDSVCPTLHVGDEFRL